MTSKMEYIIHCKLSGLQIGVLTYSIVAGHQPYLSHWDNMTALHPIFSLPKPKLLAFMRSEWARLGKLSIDNEITEAEGRILQVGFLAMLHSLDSIKQEVPALPPLHIVQSHISKVFALAYWQHYLDSKRFAFPEYKISKYNNNHDFEYIKDYLEACFSVKQDYENGVKEIEEKAKAAAAERALQALRDSWIVPTSKKVLWRWVRAHLPAKYEADAQGWMSTLFIGNDKTVLDFDIDETELMEEIIVSECPGGTGILKAVRDRIAHILDVQRNYKEAFSVDLSDYAELTPEAALIASVKGVTHTERIATAPKVEDYPTRGAFIRANAIWQLQERAKNVAN